MAISFKESPWYLQALIFVALAVVLMAVGEYAPGLPVSAARVELQTLHAQDAKLNQEVSGLQVYERRYAEFQQEMVALNKQLDTLKTIVPEDKDTDEFMRLLEGSAASSGVAIRKLTAQTVVSRDYHYDMPFEVQVDGPYYGVVDFFSRLSHLSRIINVGDLKLDGLAEGKSPYPLRPNSTITGSCVVTTFFSASDGAAAAPAQSAPAAGNKGPSRPTAVR